MFARVPIALAIPAECYRMHACEFIIAVHLFKRLLVILLSRAIWQITGCMALVRPFIAHPFMGSSVFGPTVVLRRHGKATCALHKARACMGPLSS